jgi:hypothetical protein
MRRIAPLAAVALLSGCAAAPAQDPAQVAAAPAPYRTAPSALHSENGQITGSKAVTGRSASVAEAPRGSAYAGMAVDPPASLPGD